MILTKVLYFESCTSEIKNYKHTTFILFYRLCYCWTFSKEMIFWCEWSNIWNLAVWCNYCNLVPFAQLMIFLEEEWIRKKKISFMFLLKIKETNWWTNGCFPTIIEDNDSVIKLMLSKLDGKEYHLFVFLLKWCVNANILGFLESGRESLFRI